ncbi:MAG: NAD-dependent malic enzyme, partial [Anaerolineales bacterium]|nr:NAD-dependent malic enzyme [Anaerolineales bacterium]
ALPIMLDTKDPDVIINTVKLLQPAWGGVNLEDLSQPKCFRILDTLREECEIPIWHDDQQGTATVTLAGLLNALRLTGRKIGAARIAFIGCGASNVACSRLILASGANPELCTMVDSKGILHRGRLDLQTRRTEFVDKWKLCQTTNAEQRVGGIEESLRGADVCIALSTPGPDVIHKE